MYLYIYVYIYIYIYREREREREKKVVTIWPKWVSRALARWEGKRKKLTKGKFFFFFLLSKKQVTKQNWKPSWFFFCLVLLFFLSGVVAFFFRFALAAAEYFLLAHELYCASKFEACGNLGDFWAFRVWRRYVICLLQRRMVWVWVWVLFCFDLIWFDFFQFFFSLFCFFGFPTPQARAFLESLVLFNYRVFVCYFWACISGGLLFLCVFLCCNFVGNLWVALRLYQCYVSCVPDMEVTKVAQNRAQLELIAQGDKSKFPVVVEGVGGSVGGREGGRGCQGACCFVLKQLL